MDDRQILFAECFLLLATEDGGPEELLGDQGQSRPDVARHLNWDARDRAQVQEALGDGAVRSRSTATVTG